MNIPARLIQLGAFALFLGACLFARYMETMLHGAVDDVAAAVLLIGFLIGAGATARYLRQRGLVWLLAYREKRRQRRAASVS